MKQLSVKNKFVVSFFIILTLFFVSIASSISALGNISKHYEDFYYFNHQALIKIFDIRLNMQLAIRSTTMAAVETDASKISQHIADANNYLNNIKTIISWFVNSYPGDINSIQQYDTIMNNTADLREQISNLCISNSREENMKAQQLLLNEYVPLIDNGGNIINDFAAQITLESEQNFNSTMQLQKVIFIVLIMMSVITFIASIILAVYLTKSMVNPIDQIQKAMHTVKQGNLNINIDYDSKDELGKLSNSIKDTMRLLLNIISDQKYILNQFANGNFNVRTSQRDSYVGDFSIMLESLRNIAMNLSSTMSNIDKAAEQVSSGSSQVSDGAQSLAQGTTEQASSIQQLAATINEVSSHIEKNSLESQNANQDVCKVKNDIDISNQKMQDMLGAMSDISSSSNEISKIIKDIEDIAFQTNILALNASVEAARAGAAGKGFSVVADEVRNLAIKSTAASKRTAELIENSINAVENGKHIAAETAEYLKSVVASVENVAERVNKISEASVNQANAVNEINDGVNQISNVVQTNSATAEQSAAASQELSGQAQILKELVAKFIVRDDYSVSYDYDSNNLSNTNDTEIKENNFNDFSSNNSLYTTTSTSYTAGFDKY